MNWEDCLAAIAVGDADVIDSLFKTPERERTYDFLPPYAKLPVPVFFHISISGISEPEDLRGFRVAAKAGDACIEVLKSSGIHNIVEYPDYPSIINAAANMEVRIFCMDEPPALYYIYKFGLETSFKSALNLYTGEFHRAVPKRRKPLADGSNLYVVLRKGFESISTEKYEEIDKRWFGSMLNPKVDAKFLGWIAGTLLSVIGTLLTFSIAMRRQVARKTRDLSLKAAELEASERKNLAFIRALPDLFIIMGSDDKYYECKTVNPELLALPRDQLIGKTIWELGFDPSLCQLLHDKIRKALTEPGVCVFEYDMDVLAGKLRFEARTVKLMEDRALLIIRDITAKTVAEQRVLESLRQKEVLLREVHHRVKNNMQVISSLIRLQSDKIQSEDERNALIDTQLRIRTMAQIHELLYQSEDLGSIDIAEYIEKIVDELKIAYFEASASTEFSLALEPLVCIMDVAVPLGLLVNEIVSNCLKYAAGKPVSISLFLDKDGRRHLVVQDNGPGMPDDWETKLSSTLGLTLVRALSEQLNGMLSVSASSRTRIELEF